MSAPATLAPGVSRPPGGRRRRSGGGRRPDLHANDRAKPVALHGLDWSPDGHEIAVGGADKLSAITSYEARGAYRGFDDQDSAYFFGRDTQIEAVAKFVADNAGK